MKLKGDFTKNEIRRFNEILLNKTKQISLIGFEIHKLRYLDFKAVLFFKYLWKKYPDRIKFFISGKQCSIDNIKDIDDLLIPFYYGNN